MPKAKEAGLATFRQNVEATIPALRRYARALTRDSDIADDLVQDTLERALSRWSLRRSEGDLRAWLFTIQRNLHVNRWRQDRRRALNICSTAAMYAAGCTPS
jgi:RNA polymerase sigma-70 factor (ECF subfamily)